MAHLICILALGTREEDGLAFVGTSRLPRRVGHALVAALGALAIDERAGEVVRAQTVVLDGGCRVLAHASLARRCARCARRLVDQVGALERLAIPVCQSVSQCPNKYQ